MRINVKTKIKVGFIAKDENNLHNIEPGGEVHQRSNSEQHNH